MPTVVVRHNVGNFETWLKGHEERARLFAPAVSSFKTFQDQDNPKSIVMVLEVTDMEKLGAIMNDPNIQEAKDRHTVKDPILLSIQVAV
jgi:quinol monooxygenase YgiN